MANLATPDDLGSGYQRYRDTSAGATAVEEFERRMRGREKPAAPAESAPAATPEGRDPDTPPPGWSVEEIPDREGRTQRVAISPDGSRSTLLGTVGAVAKDLGLGIIETPRQIVGGARDAVQEAMEAVEWLASIPQEWTGLGLSLPDSEINLPEVDLPRTVSGGVVRSVVTFRR